MKLTVSRKKAKILTVIAGVLVLVAHDFHVKVDLLLTWKLRLVVLLKNVISAKALKHPGANTSPSPLCFVNIVAHKASNTSILQCGLGHYEFKLCTASCFTDNQHKHLS